MFCNAIELNCQFLLRIFLHIFVGIINEKWIDKCHCNLFIGLWRRKLLLELLLESKLWLDSNLRTFLKKFVEAHNFLFYVFVHLI